MSTNDTLKMIHPPYSVVETDAGIKRLADGHYTSILSKTARERMPSAIRSLFPLEAKPGLISFLLGKPNPTMFPIESLSFSARSPTDPTSAISYSLDPEELSQGLQYSETNGIRRLRDWFCGLQEVSHGRKRGEGWDIFIGSGSQELIYKAVQALVDDGDPVLVESPVYTGVLPMFHTLHCELIGIETDAQGISAASLRTVLENWPAGKRKPKILYTVPSGCNPTGTTTALERRKQILRLAREFNFLILEDDPYFYLYYGKAPRPASYFSLEREEPEVGRVFRFDSLSKVLSSGIRIGFASGPEVLLQALDRHTETLNLQTSSLTQVITYKLLNSWGYEEFKTHAERISAFYKEKRDIFQAAMARHLDEFKLKLTHDGEDLDSETIIRTQAFEKGVLALPGRAFSPNGSKSAFVRASFSTNSEEEVNEGLRRLRETMIEARANLANSS